jgi:hypothetical protein
MSYLLAALGVWWLKQGARFFLVVPEWAWYLATTLLGLGAALWIEPSTWWYGFGVAGGAFLLERLDDLLLLLADWCRVLVLRRRH